MYVKFILIALLLSLPVWWFGMCLYEEISPNCWIDWTTFTHSCAWWSDTSSWNMPSAYQWECIETPELSEWSKDATYAYMNDFFINHNMYETKDKKYFESRNWDYRVLNIKWITFINQQLFPEIQKRIVQELERESPNYEKISLYNYVSSIIWYDYHIRQAQ